ncbi:MAG: hypothetical protein ABI369_05235 [Acetobacteraceae bacterium]
MEAVSFVAGEQWSDHPACACPIISAFLRSWNDALPDDERDALLRPLIPHLLNTRGGPELERRRALMAADWLVRIHTQTWLRLAGLVAQADVVAGLPEITDMAQCPSLMPVLNAVRNDAAMAAARAAAMDTAEAAWAAAIAATRAAAIMDTAMAVARTAAIDTAVAAARTVAMDAGVAALKATRIELRQSALALVYRMIDAGATP